MMLTKTLEKQRDGHVAAVGAERATSGEDLYDQILYIDTPIANTVSQIRPFYEDDVFLAADTPAFLKSRPALTFQTAFVRPSRLHPTRVLSARKARQLPVRRGGVVFYPFNSQSNINRVADRSVHHVLILHGESNKAASYRPAARLYDYVTIAGPLARLRYQHHAIFSPAELDGGRVVMMGDTFVQTLKWARRADADGNSAILYCPTWEGYGGDSNNYSSVSGGYGFERVAEVARVVDTTRVIVKPHPYLGTLKPRLLADFLRGLRHLRRTGLDVRVALSGANTAVRAAIHVGFGGRHILDELNSHETCLAIVDTSGMEAVFLKQKIPHMVLMDSMPAIPPLHDIYARKALLPDDATAGRMHSYLNHQVEIDDVHRSLVFGWHVPELAGMSNADRVDWLVQYVKHNKFWNDCSGTAQKQ